jgi:hypothetical protein
VEDGCAFLGGFLEEVERVLQRSWLDGMFRPPAGAVNAVRAPIRFLRKEEVIMAVFVDLAVNALDLSVS